PRWADTNSGRGGGRGKEGLSGPALFGVGIGTNPWSRNRYLQKDNSCTAIRMPVLRGPGSDFEKGLDAAAQRGIMGKQRAPSECNDSHLDSPAALRNVRKEFGTLSRNESCPTPACP